jgi:hypothetical protein
MILAQSNELPVIRNGSEDRLSVPSPMASPCERTE